MFKDNEENYRDEEIQVSFTYMIDNYLSKANIKEMHMENTQINLNFSNKIKYFIIKVYDIQKLVFIESVINIAYDIYIYIYIYIYSKR